ncbi:hypothetical protein K504DRAFT_497121 [Pleomassaria siparia CBS 279.74]|uniref:Xylanolytic transcriptional activator regulatory domain-containing protein n=1 Tax=Pleomassaria siparia CBS 279.74 TaxID=1314801 RepID=A0A6G1KQS8_9PLEO|nr:hypothetical protein K504DRAFT_497121 [Pleomassaria siparia CBS 279.74]
MTIVVLEILSADCYSTYTWARHVLVIRLLNKPGISNRFARSPPTSSGIRFGNVSAREEWFARLTPYRPVSYRATRPSVASVLAMQSSEKEMSARATMLFIVTHAALQRNNDPVPTEVSSLLGSDAKTIYDSYFSSIDTWFPFISRKRLERGIQASTPTEIPGLSLVFLCMRLITDVPHPNTPANTSVLYSAARSYLDTVEEVSPVSLHVLQAFVLISLYETSHAISPAAYLTIGRAARLGVLMGIHDRKNCTLLFKGPKTWTYEEEERRTWWAVLILERYINLNPTGLPLATPEPAQGVIGTNQALFTSDFMFDSQIGPFARCCQASHILGRVLAHRNRRKGAMTRDLVLEEALQLSAALTALDTHLSQAMDDPHNETPITILDVALCTSARLALYSMYACNQADVDRRLAKESIMQNSWQFAVPQLLGR